MLTDEKILVTGPAGQIAAPLCRFLARDNAVWGIARFSVEGSREEVEDMGVTTRVVDLAVGDFSEVPDDFTYVLHLAAAIGPSTDYDHSLRVNAEATGLLLQHCRRARAALVMSTSGSTSGWRTSRRSCRRAPASSRTTVARSWSSRGRAAAPRRRRSPHPSASSRRPPSRRSSARVARTRTDPRRWPLTSL